MSAPATTLPVCPPGLVCQNLPPPFPPAKAVPTLTGAGLLLAIIALAVITALTINPNRKP